MRKATIGIILFLVSLMLVLSACSSVNNEAAAMAEKQAMEAKTAMAEKQAMAEKTAMEEKAAMAEKEAMVAKEVMTKNDSAVMVKDNSTMMESKVSGIVLAGINSKYLEFNQADYDAAIASGKVVVLNFYANWCPACKEERVNVLAGFNQLANENVVGFQVNYKDSDTNADETELAKKYGITSQHTRVTVVDGKVASKVNTAWSSSDYVEALSTI